MCVLFDYSRVKDYLSSGYFSLLLTLLPKQNRKKVLSQTRLMTLAIIAQTVKLNETDD